MNLPDLPVGLPLCATEVRRPAVSAWRLQRTRQCAKCPWRVDVDAREIPNGYDLDRHRTLVRTIADRDVATRPTADILSALAEDEMHIMACHETGDAHCVGWLVNQLGAGNNIAMRLRMMTCSNGHHLQIIGPQHATFADTVPNTDRSPRHAGVGPSP